MNRPIFLIGYMGSGKTTLGAALAHELQVPFIDLDERIEQHCGCTIAQIFTQYGESYFRELETQQLKQLMSCAAVVACGGGTPCHSDNMACMNDSGITVWLTTSPQRLTMRLALEDEQRKRPRLSGLDYNSLLNMVISESAQREPYYSQAQMHFDATDIETAQATAATAHHLAELLRPAMRQPTSRVFTD